MKKRINSYLCNVAADKFKRELAYLIIDTTMSLLEKMKLKLRKMEKLQQTQGRK